MKNRECLVENRELLNQAIEYRSHNIEVSVMADGKRYRSVVS
jgi:hypothetical protein